jgi:hypothetical protein
MSRYQDVPQQNYGDGGSYGQSYANGGNGGASYGNGGGGDYGGYSDEPSYAKDSCKLLFKVAIFEAMLTYPFLFHDRRNILCTPQTIASPSLPQSVASL